MKTILHDIQKTVILYADILAQILKVDVTIVDNQMNRIAGSGRLLKEINTNMADEGHIFRYAMNTGETQIISAPGKEQVCLSCPKSENCRETFHMCTPIMLNGSAIGGIAFVCFNEQQRKHAMKNKDVFEQFLKQFAELITLSAKRSLEERRTVSMVNLLESIVDHIDCGIMVLRQNKQIVRMNTVGKRILRMMESDITGISDIKMTGNKILGLDEYLLSFSNKTYRLIGKIFDIDIDNYSSVFLFQEAEQLPQTTLSLNGTVPKGVSAIIGKSQKIIDLKRDLLMLSTSASPVLISGESGTETKIFARAMHEESNRQKFPFISANCTTIPHDLMEEELFGCTRVDEKSKGKVGKIELANNGTLMLEEICDLPLFIQTKLLSLLEEQKIMRVGAKKPTKVNVRVIGTTSKSISDVVNAGLFLKSLYYRLNVIPLNIPPLRDRDNDVVLLAKQYIQQYSKSMGKTVHLIEQDFWNHIEQYSWPGNVWELQNAMEYVMNVMRLDGMISAKLLPSNILGKEEVYLNESLNLKDMERKLISQAIEIYGNHSDSKQRIADSLGIGVATLYRKMKIYGFR
ncbi:sigma 54-interacting transcriptional regulator [Lacrimispora sp.]|uniref:sigma 54-interacting transcriptional regulator n=1 Tax=Lacrimispora sp. TaxID=2719234 RepID=UPI002FDA83B0